MKLNMANKQTPQQNSIGASRGRSGGSVVWSREKINELIELYKRNECLWNVWHSDYKSKEKRNRAIENICRTLNISKFDFGKKIHNLRNQFNTEMKKLEQRMEEAGEDEGKPNVHCKWSHFEPLMFLRNVIEPRPGTYQSGTYPIAKKMRLRFEYNSTEEDANVTVVPQPSTTNNANQGADDMSQLHYEEDNNAAETSHEDFQNFENELNEAIDAGRSEQMTIVSEETIDQKYIPTIQQQRAPQQVQHQHFSVSTSRSSAQQKQNQQYSNVTTNTSSDNNNHHGNSDIINLNHENTSIIELNSSNLSTALISNNKGNNNEMSPSTPINPVASSTSSSFNPNQTTTTTINTPAPATRDQWDAFGELVATEFRNLNSDLSRKKLKRKIMQAMLEVGEEDDGL
ncbi:uncharacterized protein [Musca autumnalis]|uniref:uncharacterized protein n=1 Tax=Musca autumnalis TaxID=221902 RepID=UPI003CF823B9